MSLMPIPDVLKAMQAGRMIVLVDDESRENEGDIVVAAEHSGDDQQREESNDAPPHPQRGSPSPARRSGSRGFKRIFTGQNPEQRVRRRGYHGSG